jgi:hypothetical protein
MSEGIKITKNSRYGLCGMYSVETPDDGFPQQRNPWSAGVSGEHPCDHLSLTTFTTNAMKEFNLNSPHISVC